MLNLKGYNASGRIEMDCHFDTVSGAMLMIEMEVHSFRNPFGIVMFRLFDGGGLVLVNNVRR
jgi:hypothetical protein